MKNNQPFGTHASDLGVSKKGIQFSDQALQAAREKLNRRDCWKCSHVKKDDCLKRVTPNLLFIGQMYSGSTSLSNQMLLHPKLDFGTTKEHQFFRAKFDSIKSDQKYDQYLEEFWVSCNTTTSFDATMDYLKMAGDAKYGLDAVKYLRSRLGNDIKLMVMFRDPVEHILHKACTAGHQKDDFTNNALPNGTMEIPDQLSTWLKVYPNKAKWLFLSSDDYFKSPQSVLNKVTKFIGVEKYELAEDELMATGGRRRCKAKASPEQRKAFWSVESNMEIKRSLEELTGLKFQWHQKS